MSESNDELAVLPTLMAYRATAAHGFAPPTFGALKEAGMRRRRRNRVIVVSACVAVLGLSAAVAVNAMPMRGTQPPIGESATPAPSIPPIRATVGTAVDATVGTTHQPAAEHGPDRDSQERHAPA